MVSMVELIGTGTYADVYIEEVKEGVRVAVKRTKLECPVWACLPKHPNLLSLIKTEKSKKNVFLYTTKYCQRGDLFNLTQQCGKLPYNVAVRMLHGIATGLQALHRANIAHRDIKLENILLDETYSPVICDFDFSIKAAGTRLYPRCGSIPYCAPEVLTAAEHDPRRADCWSLGVVLFAMLTGRLPFDSQQGNREIIKKIISNEYQIPQSIDSQLKTITAGLLTTNPDDRLTICDVLGMIQLSEETGLVDQIDQLSRPVGHPVSPPRMILHPSLEFCDDPSIEGYKLIA